MPRSRGGRRGIPGGRRQSSPARGVELDRFSTADLRTWQRHAENLEAYHVQLYFHLESLRALEHDRLCAASCSSKAVQLVLDGWVRIVDYRYSLQPLSATGSLVHGGRFNVGADLDPLKFPTFAALYLAENYDTAYEEKFGAPPLQEATLAGREFALRRPASFTSVNVSGQLTNLFDLRSGAASLWRPSGSVLATLQPLRVVLPGIVVRRTLHPLFSGAGFTSGRLTCEYQSPVTAAGRPWTTSSNLWA